VVEKKTDAIEFERGNPVTQGQQKEKGDRSNQGTREHGGLWEGTKPHTGVFNERSGGRKTWDCFVASLRSTLGPEDQEIKNRA